MPRTGVVWNYFRVVDEVDKKAECNYCKKILSFKTTITNLKNHLKHKHVIVFEAIKQDRNDATTRLTGIADSNYGQDDSSGLSSGGEPDPLKPKRTRTETAFERKHFVTLTSSQPQMLNDSTAAVVLPQQFVNEYEDECFLFCKLVALKLRKVPEERRDFVMLKINEVFYNESQERHELTANNDTTVE